MADAKRGCAAFAGRAPNASSCPLHSLGHLHRKPLRDFAGTALVMDRSCSWSDVAPRSRNTGIEETDTAGQARISHIKRTCGAGDDSMARVSTSATTTDSAS